MKLTFLSSYTALAASLAAAAACSIGTSGLATVGAGSSGVGSSGLIGSNLDADSGASGSLSGASGDVATDAGGPEDDGTSPSPTTSGSAGGSSGMVSVGEGSSASGAVTSGAMTSGASGSASDADSSASSEDSASDADMAIETGPEAGPDAGHLSFAVDVYPIIEERCIACHIPGGAGVTNGHLDMTTNLAAGAYSQLMMKAMGVVAGGAATTCAASALDRVVPGSSATSLLYDKVNSKLLGVPALCGNPMPNPTAAVPLTMQQVTTIQVWIDEGAAP